MKKQERIMGGRTYGEGICRDCEKTFTKNAPNQARCDKCRKPKPNKMYKERKCQVCHGMYQPASPSQKYCPECKLKVDRERDYNIKLRNRTEIKNRECLMCGTSYTPTGNTQKYCEACRGEADKNRQKEYNQKHLKGYNQEGENNNNWKGGIGIYTDLAYDVYKLPKECNRCNSEKFLCVHHIDRDRYNNEKSNLEILCKSCHQIEHNAGKNLHPNSPKYK